MPSHPPTTPTLLHTRINGKVRTFVLADYPNTAALWWAMQEEGRGIRRPETQGVRVHDMAAFIRDAVPLPTGVKHSPTPE